MDKVLEALERLKTAPTFMGGTAEYQACTKSETLLMQDYETVKQALQRLESIDNANPSDALECLEEIGFAPLNECCGYPYTRISDEYDEDFNTIKAALLKAQEQGLPNGGRLPNKELLCLKQTIEQRNDKPMFYISEMYGNKYIVPQKQFDDLAKVLEIIKEKKVNIGIFYHVVFILKASYEACKLNNGNFAFHICDTRKEFLTLEEFEMLKKWLKEKE